MRTTRTRPATRRKDLAQELGELVRFRSDRPGDRVAIAALAEKKLRALGARVERHGPKESPALLASFGEGGVLFSGHLDTVPATGDWSRKPGEVRAGRMYGRGTADMKGGVAAILHAASELVGRVPFSVALTTDEETAMAGAHALLKAKVVRAARALVVAEPTGLRVGLAEKSVHFYEIATAGRSAHASMPWTGDSATGRMLVLLETLRHAFPFRGKDGTTVNVGVLKGGVKVNVIADACAAEVDFRVPGATSAAPHERRVRAILKGTGVPHRLRRVHFVPALHQDPTHPLLLAFEQVAHQPRGTIYFATEAAVFSKLGKPTVICGPGAQESAHVTDEFVPLSEVREASRIYRDYAMRVGGRV